MPDEPAARLLFAEAYRFDFFQAVLLLERLHPDFPRHSPPGREGPPGREAVRLRAHAGTSFPASEVYSAVRPRGGVGPVDLTLTFFGLVGFQGALPHHYTETVIQAVRRLRGDERTALRDWLDLFTHRAASLFYRAWEKYRFAVPFVRSQAGDDPFTLSVAALAGLGSPPLRGRLRVVAPRQGDKETTPDGAVSLSSCPLARVDDLSLMYYAGILAQRPRNALNLERLLADYFGLPVRVEQFSGQWLMLDEPDRTSLHDGDEDDTDGPRLGENTIAGEKVWDAQSKFRLRVGPLGLRRFCEMLPDPSARPGRKSFFLFCQLARLFAGPGLDFEVQLVLRRDEVPDAVLIDGDDDDLGARLGWNTWALLGDPDADAEDAFFEADEGVKGFAAGPAPPPAIEVADFADP